MLSPLLWLVTIIQVPGRAQEILSREEQVLRGGKEVLIQLFADDISAAISAENGNEVVRRARLLVIALQMVLKAIGLELSIAKCKKFLIKLREEALSLFKRQKETSKWFKKKERIREAA